MKFVPIFLPLLWFQGCHTVSVRTYLKELESHLEVNGPKVPPVLEGETETSVKIKFLPANILEVDSAKQLMTMSGSFFFEWDDPDATWNASDYGGIEAVTIHATKMWVPDLALVNAFENVFIIDNVHTLFITSNGHVHAGTYSIYTITCTLDIYEFPFDTQHCDLIVRSMDLFKVKLESSKVPYKLSEQGKIVTEWELLDVSVFEAYQDGQLQYHRCRLTITRQSSFYVTSIIFPMTLTSLMTSSVFLIPAESGEKISFLVSIFISNAVFFNYINDLMPRASSKTPKMTIYVVIVLCHNFVLLFYTACELMIHHNMSKVLDVASTNDKPATLERKPLKRTKKNLILFGISVTVVVATTLFIVL